MCVWSLLTQSLTSLSDLPRTTILISTGIALDCHLKAQKELLVSTKIIARDEQESFYLQRGFIMILFLLAGQFFSYRAKIDADAQLLRVSGHLPVPVE